ncbi:2'-5'-oligoadenylate synthase 2 isoform X1 [Loxodonta africana]|uniref:2'-5'-oligoadenylate synthase 2 n=1 Tax=Elephas maximus indicus TaxID=99487 RepID=UPI000C8117E6|nr:2'-5'-oligoadenylate synthase 2 [Loxodonta africana]XP_049722837.1 2'-5'-oligoadenylate synthase 2 [Elephas maximus indicus]
MGSWWSQQNSIPAENLEMYIQLFLQPQGDCQKLIDHAVNTICAVLQDAKDFPLVKDVAKGGSYGRETVLRGTSDGTLVIYLSEFKQFLDQKTSEREIILKEIWKRLEASQHLKEMAAKLEVQQSQGQLILWLSTKGQSIIFEVLPAFNALGFSKKPSPEIYRELKRVSDATAASPGEFSTCFMKLQQKFFNDRPRKLKDLILLVKYWYQQCRKELEKSTQLPVYALELLTVYAWEQGCGQHNFDIAEGIRTVLGLIKQYKHLCVYWTAYYNFEDETIRNILQSQLRASRPVILDPTDPMNNVSRDKNECWELLNLKAREWLSSLSLNDSSPGPSWNILPAPLYATPGHLLDKFIHDFLQPSKNFLDQTNKAVDIICRFLREKCFQHSEDQKIKIQKIVRGGSTAKGTALKSGSDADLILFPNLLKSFPSQKHNRSEIIKEIHKQLEACQQEEKFKVKVEIAKWKSPRALSFSLKSKEFNAELEESVEFDVLPAFNVLGQWGSVSPPSPSIYAELIQQYESGDYIEGEFSSCFTELQRDFIISRPTKLKSLIRLVKYWYKQCERKLKTKGSLPPKYALELLTVYAWEQGSRALDFSTAEGFRTVLELVTKYQQLCIFWKVNYNFEDVIVGKFLLAQIQKTRPVILDPAEPTGDVGGGDRWCWHLLAQEAKAWLLSSLCFKDGVGNPVKSWNVPTAQTLERC